MNVDFLIFILLLLVLVVSGIITTRSLSVISSYLKLSHFTAGFIIMAIVTGIPELLVGVNSAMAGIPQLSLGDVIGSNIINLSMVLGLAVLIGGQIEFSENPIKKETIYLFLIALLPLLLAWDQNLSQLDGVILLGVFFIYFFIVYRNKNSNVDEDNDVSRELFLRNTIIFAGGVFALLVSSRYLVYYASLIASEIGIPIFLVGVLLVSFGTSLPELSFETISILHGYQFMAVGDLMGSTVANSTLVLGLVSIISPITISNFSQFQLTSIFLIFFIFMFIGFIRSNTGINRFRAVFLIVTYLLFVLLVESNVMSAW
ncbi:MAG: sodium:calcium antiporter [Methanobacterium sp.]|nr:sodium:calcium antiporter [Methanobacterium sp.]